jgi:hypothetical protein
MGVAPSESVDAKLTQLRKVLQALEDCDVANEQHRKRLQVVFKESMSGLMVEDPEGVVTGVQKLATTEPIRQRLLGNYVERCILLKVEFSQELLLEIIGLSTSWLTLDALLRHFVKDEFSRKRVEKRKIALVKKNIGKR